MAVDYEERESVGAAPAITYPDADQATQEQLLRGQLREMVDSKSAFDEHLTHEMRTIFSLKPTWGLSRLRDIQDTAGSGAIAEDGGELKLSLTTASTDEATLTTSERGQYIAGTSCQAGIGVRLGSLPVDSQVAQWGYFDDNNGFGFGVDTTGFYCFVRRDSSDTLIRSGSFSQNNPTIDVTDGAIFQVDFIWYGYGTVEFSIINTDPDTNKKQRTVLHRYTPDSETSIVDPHQPIRVECTNGGSGASSALNVYVGGRQVSVGRSNIKFQKRQVPEFLTDYTVGGTADTWIPVAAVRLKSTFQGRNTSVLAFLERIKVETTQDIDIKIEVDAQVTASFASAGDWDAAETALEYSTGGSITSVDTAGLPIVKDFVRQTTSSPNSVDALANEVQIPIRNDSVSVVYVRYPGSAPDINLVVTCSEQW